MDVILLQDVDKVGLRARWWTSRAATRVTTCCPAARRAGDGRPSGRAAAPRRSCGRATRRRRVEQAQETARRSRSRAPLRDEGRPRGDALRLGDPTDIADEIWKKRSVSTAARSACRPDQADRPPPDPDGALQDVIVHAPGAGRSRGRRAAARGGARNRARAEEAAAPPRGGRARGRRRMSRRHRGRAGRRARAGRRSRACSRRRARRGGRAGSRGRAGAAEPRLRALHSALHRSVESCRMRFRSFASFASRTPGDSRIRPASVDSSTNIRFLCPA